MSQIKLNLGSAHLPQNARAYISDWLRNGYLERHFPSGALGEEYQLSSAAVATIRFVTGLAEPRLATTESRLAVVIQQVVRLAERTDANPETRIASLLAERERLDREIEQIHQGHVDVLSDHRALKRIREIITLADGLAANFRRVREDFDVLNRGFRERIFDEAGSRGEILENLFARVDVMPVTPGNFPSITRRALSQLLAGPSLDGRRHSKLCPLSCAMKHLFASACPSYSSNSSLSRIADCLHLKSQSGGLRSTYAAPHSQPNLSRFSTFVAPAPVANKSHRSG